MYLNRLIKNFWFDCNNCVHSFDISNGVQRGFWCKYCCICSNILCDDKIVNFVLIGLFFGKSIYWSNKNKDITQEKYKLSHIKCWFNCDKCDMSFESVMSNVNKVVGARIA
jgi:hypothetical protein